MITLLHVSLDSVHLLLKLGSLGVHARDDVADITDDRSEHKNCDQKLDDDENVLEDGSWMRNVTHHGQRQSRPVERVSVRVE